MTASTLLCRRRSQRIRIMALNSCDDNEATSMSYDQEDSFTNLVRFVDVASSRIRQALDRPRRCRRRVNHRKYLARVLSGVDVDGSARNDHVSERRRGYNDSPSKPVVTTQSGLQSKKSKRRPLQSIRRYSRVKAMQSAVLEGSRSFAVVSPQRSDHINSNNPIGLSELDNAIPRYALLQETVLQTQCRQTSVSSSFHLSEPVTAVPADVSSHPHLDQMTSIVGDEPRHSWFVHRPAVCVPQQSQQLSLELSAGTLWYQTGFRQPRLSDTGMRHIHNEDYSSFANQQSLNLPLESIYRQGPPSIYGVNESLNMSSSSWKYDDNDNDYSCSCSYWSSPSVVPPTCAYNSCKDAFINFDTMNYLMSHSLQHQQSNTSDFNLPCIMPAAVRLFQTGTSGGHRNDWRLVGGANHFVDASPSSFNDSGLGSASFGSATDVDCSSSPDSSFVWSSNYGFCPLQPTETFRDSVSVQTVW